MAETVHKITDAAWLSAVPNTHGPFVYNGVIFCPLITGGAAVMYRSADSGVTWTIADNGASPALPDSYLFGFRLVDNEIIAACFDGVSVIYVAHLEPVSEGDPWSPSAHLRVCAFDCAAETWGADSANGPLVYCGGYSEDSKRFYAAYRETDGAVVCLYNTTPVSDSAWFNPTYIPYLENFNTGRVNAIVYDPVGGGWSDDTEMFGYADGTANFEACGIVAGAAGRMHCFARQDPGNFSANTTVLKYQQRTFDAANNPLAIDQFETDGSSMGRPGPQPPGRAVIGGTVYIAFAWEAADFSSNISCGASAGTFSFSTTNVLIESEVAELAGDTTAPGVCGGTDHSMETYFFRLLPTHLGRGVSEGGCGSWVFDARTITGVDDPGDTGVFETMSIGNTSAAEVGVAFAGVQIETIFGEVSVSHRYYPVYFIGGAVAPPVDNCCCAAQQAALAFY